MSSASSLAPGDRVGPYEVLALLGEGGGGPPRAVTGEGVTLAKIGRPVSPDGERVVANGPHEIPALYPLGGGEPAAIPGLGELDVALCWTADGQELFVARYDEAPPKIERVRVATGATHPWTGLHQSVPSGLQGDYRILVTPDGRSYAYISRARSATSTSRPTSSEL